MSKKPLRHYNEEFLALERHWYGILKAEGFVDVETPDFPDHYPLKQWRGYSGANFPAHQPPDSPLISSFPEGRFNRQEYFANHPGFQDVCQSLCRHGNSSLSPLLVDHIWRDYCAGKTTRESELTYHVSDTTVFHVIRKVSACMNLMESEPDASPVEPITVIIRAFEPTTDQSFVYATWRHTLWDAEKRDERVASQFYSKATHAIRKLLSRPDASVRIATDSAHSDFIVGYSVWTNAHLEFVYVKFDYQKRGIGKLLCKGIESVSHPFTQVGQKIVEKWNLKVQENHADPH